MKRLAALLLTVLVITGCGASGISGSHIIYAWHDQQRLVTCWTLETENGVAISCLPDSSFTR